MVCKLFVLGIHSKQFKIVPSNNTCKDSAFFYTIRKNVSSVCTICRAKAKLEQIFPSFLSRNLDNN